MSALQTERAKRKRAEAERFRRRYGGHYYDPTPGPYPGQGPIVWRQYETPENRAYRRFPIDRHKPRYDEPFEPDEGTTTASRHIPLRGRW